MLLNVRNGHLTFSDHQARGVWIIVVVPVVRLFIGPGKDSQSEDRRHAPIECFPVPDQGRHNLPGMSMLIFCS